MGTIIRQRINYSGGGGSGGSETLDEVLTNGNVATEKTMELVNDIDQSTGDYPDVIKLRTSDNKNKFVLKPDVFSLHYDDEIVNPQDPSDVRERSFSIENNGADIYLTKADMQFGEHDNFTAFLGADHLSVSGYRDTDPSNPVDLNNFSMEWGETAFVSMSDDLKAEWQKALEIKTLTAGEGINIANDIVSTDDATTSEVDAVTDSVFGNQSFTPVGTQYDGIYSADEKQVGVWIDGRPVYQRVITGLSVPAAASGDFTIVDLSPYIANNYSILEYSGQLTSSGTSNETKILMPYSYTPNSATQDNGFSIWITKRPATNEWGLNSTIISAWTVDFLIIKYIKP